MEKFTVVVYTKEGKFELTELEWQMFDQRLLHRKDGPAVIKNDGIKFWFFNGQRHRLGGPATEWNQNEKEWWANGKRHRIDGPAVEWNDSQGYPLMSSYYIDGNQINSNSIEQWIEENDIDLSTEAGQVAFVLKWG